ncbi:hypothetical protein VPH35_068003 [Triticum aestivum]|uniref:Uncharacterized protein n=1 Tax=Triticum urartu TaxID=4572 RepID=A0A8R7Q740_TRIUA
MHVHLLQAFPLPATSCLSLPPPFIRMALDIHTSTTTFLLLLGTQLSSVLSAARTYKPSKLTFLCTGCTDRGVQVVASVHPRASDSHTLLAVCRVSLSSHAFIRLCN